MRTRPKINFMDESRETPRISGQRLRSLGDWICIRDPRGRSLQPALVPARESGDLEVHGSFTVIQRFSITPAEGKSFVEASRDSNPIHTQDTVVPGAMTTARFILLPEILIPGLAVKGMRVKFKAFSRYGLPTVNIYSFRMEGSDLLDVELQSLQGGVVVAEGSLSTRMEDPSAVPAVEVPGPSAEVIRDFLRSVRVQPERFLSFLGFNYPRAFLAALPPGEMVRLGGAGGLLNILDLEFPDAQTPAITEEPLPKVEVEQTRPRNTFRKILARVGNGIRTYCHGYATVLASMVLGTSRKRESHSASTS